MLAFRGSRVPRAREFAGELAALAEAPYSVSIFSTTDAWTARRSSACCSLSGSWQENNNNKDGPPLHEGGKKDFIHVTRQGGGLVVESTKNLEELATRSRRSVSLCRRLQLLVDVHTTGVLERLHHRGSSLPESLVRFCLL